jgi:uncharacterized Zn finger protein (UPF0148 family)
MSEKKEIVYQNGIYYCPICGSKKITVHTSAALSKSEDANTGKYIDTSTNRPYKMSNREKAAAYDRATTEGIGCWNFECRKCGWLSETLVE